MSLNRKALFGFALSGLQEFVYDLSPTAPSREERRTGGGRDTDAARRLRLRSTLLTLIPALVLREAKQNDKDAEPIYIGGGKLLLKANADAVAKVEENLNGLYTWLVQHSLGRLGAYWASVEGEADLEGVRKLLEKLSEAKWQAGRHNGWHNFAGKIHDSKSMDTLGDREWESAEGAKFAKGDGNRDWVGFKVGQGGWTIGPWQARMVIHEPDIAIAGRAKADIKVAIPTYTPRDSDGETIKLHELAEFDENGDPRPGGAYLALLKLDGDGIGLLMKNALEADNDLKTYGEVSGKLTDFFGPSLMAFLKEKYPRLYLVYSGGDDMVAAGHFADVLNAAKDIRNKFNELSLKHKDGKHATLSAGITFFTRNSPILKAIEAAEEELQNAKDVRDAVSLGGCRLGWQDFERSLSEIEAFVEAIKSETINRGALQLLRQLGEPWLNGSHEKYSDHKWRSIPMMYYTRSRRTGWKENEWPQELTQLFDSLQSDEKDWSRAALVGTLAAWRTKTKQEES